MDNELETVCELETGLRKLIKQVKQLKQRHKVTETQAAEFAGMEVFYGRYDW